ncbi:hypothetical protein [Arcticibacterium luteifluviistationis]|uniref:Uncharacterized protein n=1 Tax=Arcticibacterium luteifluviistationis TaxID=1784714 RepID=A0A2Z4GEN3_9BACT|nr:hypothetical protein [Arcticibacterium luteifluviistationis]AWV99303.1 hypothetical protein DJ013_14465 [Arcticibacterium luteifluviistationis]
MRIFFAIMFVAVNCFGQKYPNAEISNGLITAKILLPKEGKGYYQGTRFDWSGVVSELEYGGHSFFGVWNPKFEEGLHDAIMGPVEEFTVIGYDEANVGETFLKIGVGELEKPKETSYSRFKTYQIKNHGKRKVKVGKDQVQFTQNLKMSNGYAYHYSKKMKLERSNLILSHSLKNTGDKAIKTSVYNHNFFMIDNEPTNANIKTSFVFDIKPEGMVKGFGSTASIEDNAIVFNRAVSASESVFSSEVTGFGSTSKDYDILIENLKTKAGVHITSDRPINNMVFWACATTSCPEPYTKVEVQPGETFTWTINYEFFN